MARREVPFNPDAQEENRPLYWALGGYLLLLALVAMYSYRRRRELQASAGPVKAMFGGSFSSWVLAGTIFSSIFTGYTVVGVPQDARTQGYVVLQYLGGAVTQALGLLLMWPRLRRLSDERKYMSPFDFVGDRYRNLALTTLCSICGSVSMVIFLVVQLVSLGELVNGMTAGLFSKLASMVAVSVVMLILEKSGGMNSVVLSDVIQGAIMVMGFVLLLVVVSYRYSWLPNLGESSCPLLEYANSTLREALPTETPGLCSNPPPLEAAECDPFGCIAIAKPDFLSTPNSATKWQWTWFVVNFFTFSLSPHMLQRCYVAESDKALHYVILIMLFAPFVSFLPSIVAGLTVAAYEPGWSAAATTADAFVLLTSELKKFGAFEYGLVTLLSCSALAAIMSSADSVLLATSNVLAVDVYKGAINPKASEETVRRCGEICSVVLVVLCIGLGMLFTSDQIADLLLLQNGILAQTAPAFLFGLYLNISSRALCAGIIAGGVSILPAYAAYGREDFFEYVVPPIFALGVNLQVMVIAQAIGGNLTAFEEDQTSPYAVNMNGRFGEQLDKTEIRSVMSATTEPHKGLALLCIIALPGVMPWYASSLASDTMILGMPLWAAAIFAFVLIETALLWCFAKSWVPQKNPGDSDLDLRG